MTVDLFDRYLVFLLYSLYKVIRIIIVKVMLDYLQMCVGATYVSPKGTVICRSFYWAQAAEQRPAQSVMLVN